MKKYTRKYALIFILIAFAISITIWPLASRQSISTTQKDPGTAETDFSVSTSHILDYGGIAGALAQGGSISDLVKELDLDISDMPADIQFIIQTYNDLLSDITNKLEMLEGVHGQDGVDDVDGVLDEIELLLGQSEFDETSLKITDAEYLIEYIGHSLEDMDNANEQIKSIMGSFTPAEQMEVAKELRSRLVEDTERLETLKETYEASAPQNISTTLDLEVDDYAYPGLPYQIYGQISYGDGISPVERDISLFWDNDPIDIVYTYRDQNTFEIEFTPDGNSTLGRHVLKVIVLAQGEYGSTSVNKTVNVIQVTPAIKIEDLSYKILSRKIHVLGKVTLETSQAAETSLKDAAVLIEIKGTSTRVPTSEEGEFEALVGLPFGLVNLGEQQMKISFDSSEKWQSSTEITAAIFLMDIFSVGFISTAFIVVGMIVYVARRGRPVKGGGWVIEETHISDPIEESNNTSIWEFREEDLPGTRGQILKSYTEAMKRVEGVTGMYIEPYMTLREFLRESRPKLNGAAEAFSKLTSLAESALYSHNAPGLEDSTRAQNYAQTTREVLKP